MTGAALDGFRRRDGNARNSRLDSAVLGDMWTEAARNPGLRRRTTASAAVVFPALTTVVVAGALAEWREPEQAQDPFPSARATIPAPVSSASPPWRATQDTIRLPEPLDGIEWNPGRPLEVAVRVPIERGVSVGAAAEIEVPRAALDAFMGGGIGWNASATVDLDLEVPGGWRLSAGAGARSLPTEGADAPGYGPGDAEGVVWLRIGTTF